MSDWEVFTAGLFLRVGHHASPNRAMEADAKGTRVPSPRR
jgi:hypothetical protein